MNILAANDQENLVHSLQAGAAGKSLNAGVKGFGAKTPGHKAPKTPFKVPLNDENVVFKPGKSVLQAKGKGAENLLMTAKKGGKLDENAFVTPAGPGTRAPLGMKTTNAKARAFQTPAPLSGSAKTQKISPRLRRPKVKVLQQELQDEEQDDVPEVEYMPPKEVPLPDNIDDDMPPINWDFPQFKGANMTRNAHRLYLNPVEDDGRTKREREYQESLIRDKKKTNEDFDALFADIMAKETAEAFGHLEAEFPKKTTPKEEAPKKTVVKTGPLQKKTAAPSTVKARSAAAVLSSASKSGFNAPTASARARVPTSQTSSKKPVNIAIDPSATRNAAAAAASKSTIGYAKGRATGPTVRKPLSNVTRPPSSTSTTRRPVPTPSAHSRQPSSTSASASGTTKSRAFSRSSSTSTNATLVDPSQATQHQRTAEDAEREAMFLHLQESDDEEDVNLWINQFGGQDVHEDDLEEFQFEVPAGLDGDE